MMAPLRGQIGCYAMAALILSGCAETTNFAPAAEPPSELFPRSTITSAPGSIVGSVGVLKNYFFNAQAESCTGFQIKGTQDGYLSYAECTDQDTYFWLFNDSIDRDGLLPEIQNMELPMLISEEWVIASPLDLEAAQDQMGGAINTGD